MALVPRRRGPVRANVTLFSVYSRWHLIGRSAAGALDLVLEYAPCSNLVEYYMKKYDAMRFIQYLLRALSIYACEHGAEIISRV